MSVTSLPLKVQLTYDAAWQDITSYVALGEGDNITITRGRQNEGSPVDASQCTLTLNNKDGRFSPRNPTSPLYGKIGRNTPLRVQVWDPTVPGWSTRFTGEVSAWPQSWNDTGTDVWTKVTASGIMRRLGQGQSPVMQGYKDYLLSFIDLNLSMYYPLDDAKGSSYGRAAGSFATDSSYRFRQTDFKAGSAFTFGDGVLSDSLPNTLSISSTGTATYGPYPPRYMYGFVGVGNSADQIAIDFVFKSDNLSVLEIVNNDYGQYYGLSDNNRWRCQLNADGVNNNVKVILDYTDSSAVQHSTTLGTSAGPLTALSDGELHFVRFKLANSGGDTTYSVSIDGTSVLTGTATGQVLYGIDQIQCAYQAGDGSPVALGHIAVWLFGSEPTATDELNNLFGYDGEVAGRRIERLCAALGVAFGGDGDLDATIALGPQPSADFLGILHDAEDTDLGIIYEPRTFLGLGYRTRAAIYNQTPAVTLNYANGEIGTAPEPTDDDQDIHNDVTVSNYTGTSVEDILTSGMLSTQSPPNGINAYDTSVSVNCVSDGLLPDQAAWRLHMGTVDEARYPALQINMVNPAIYDTAQISGVLLLNVGDRAVITNMPAWVPGDVSLLVQGYTETIAINAWDIAFNCTPESPYQVGIYGTDRFDAENSTLNTSSTSTATSMSVASGANTQPWTTDVTAVPFDINIGGERIRVTAVSGASSPQTFTVTRSINGVVKTHAVGDKVALWKTPRFAL